MDYPLRNDRDWLNRTLVRWGRDDAEPTFSYEPTGLIDLPPGHRGYGADERIEMTDSIDEYNDGVIAAQAKEGRLDTYEEMGSQLRRGAWQAEAG
jgi:fumarate reductase flavoprotein subunit